MNVVLDIVGGPYLQKNCEAVAQDGRIVLIGWMGGMTVKEWDMMALIKKRISLIGARPSAFSDDTTFLDPCKARALTRLFCRSSAGRVIRCLGCLLPTLLSEGWSRPCTLCVA